MKTAFEKWREPEERTGYMGVAQPPLRIRPVARRVVPTLGPRSPGGVRSGAKVPTPWHAVLVVALAWIFVALLTVIYSMAMLVWLPVLPMFILGPLAILNAAHSYAADARAQAASRSNTRLSVASVRTVVRRSDTCPRSTRDRAYF